MEIGVFHEPKIWDESFRTQKPIWKTSLFYSCFCVWFWAAALIPITIVKLLIVKEARLVFAVPVLALAEVFVFYHGNRMLEFIAEIRCLLASDPDNTYILPIARWTTRLFQFAMLGFALAMMLVQAFMSR
jgi:hypothetical protein